MKPNQHESKNKSPKLKKPTKRKIQSERRSTYKKDQQAGVIYKKKKFKIQVRIPIKE